MALPLLNELLFELKEQGYQSSAIATELHSEIQYLAWYQDYACIDDKVHLGHLGAVMRKAFDMDSGKKTKLDFGAPGSIIISGADSIFRHLTLEERAVFEAGYDQPEKHFDPTNAYDHVDGKPLN